ncbi:MAG: hypothetical protein J0L60_14845 [Ignavibacteria bacterium]|nr:hypothetical protein [Ignavibacteria bacterium]
MNDKLFVIAVGGTGMRCLESFTHLCAIGMFDNQEIEILTLDTDQTNGNKARAEQLIDLYNRIKKAGNIEGGTPNANTFFSAKLNLYKFYTDYSDTKRKNFKNISNLTHGDREQQRNNKLIADLFLDAETVQQFDLAHGYRSQTHLGSYLMYHGIVEAARNLLSGESAKTQEKELGSFMDKLQQTSTNARVFIFGSVFGGTGASSIPILPKAFQDFIKIRSKGSSSLDFDKTKFGSTLLTEYFTFKKPDQKQMSSKEDSVIADSTFFPLNSQAALQFYIQDPTVQNCYKILYHIGWPIESKSFDQVNGGEKTITGGSNQKNPCHITELLCACAAYDFFTRTQGLDSQKAEYVYKAVEYHNNSFNFSFNDFVGSENNSGDLFANRLGAFFSLAHISLSLNEAASDGPGISGFIDRFEKMKINEYSTITSEERKEINQYFKHFGYSIDGQIFNPGWIYQIRSTIGAGTFMFDNKAFTTNYKELRSIDVGALFSDPGNHWPKGSFISSRYDEFVKTLINVQPTTEQKVSSTKERFLAHIYNAITKSQNFIKV